MSIGRSALNRPTEAHTTPFDRAHDEDAISSHNQSWGIRSKVNAIPVCVMPQLEMEKPFLR